MKENQELIEIEYKNICPLDKSSATFEEIYNYGLCQRDFLKFKKNFWELKEETIDPEEFLDFQEDYLILQNLKKFQKFFQEKTGHKPLKLQIYWAKRALKKESFSIIAPTGIGKTTFGNVLAHFFEGKVYYLVPSKILLQEIEKKLKEINSGKKILVIKEKEDKELLKGDFDILITTSNFLHRNYDLLPKNFDLIFIDDADSLIRQPKNIDKVLKLIKFKDEEIETALKIIDQKRKARNKEDFQNIKSLNFNKENKGMVIVASATLTPKTKRIALFRELLNFEIGSATTYLRNIKEVYEEIEKENLWQRSVFWIKKLGDGGFVFLSSDYTKNDLEDYLKFLEKNGISSLSYEKFNAKNREKFLNNDIKVVVGFSNIRNPLTRGIDLPEKVRYALFVGVPKFKIALKSSYAPMHLFLLGLSLREILEKEEEKRLLEKNLNFLRKISFLKEEQVLADENLKRKLEPIKNIYDKILASKDLEEKIKKHPRLALEIKEKEIYLIVSDPKGYLQASGRTSRLFPLGLTQGLSLILTENIKVLKHLEDKLKILGYESKFEKVEEVELEKILKKIDEDRKIVKKVLKGEEFSFEDPIETALVIVESPTKAKTIANFFGKPARRIKDGIIFYEVSLGNLHLNICATLGHFVDLVQEEDYYGVKKEKDKFVPIFQPLKICSQCQRNLKENEKECPVCKSEEFIEKEKLIKNLQKIAQEVDRIYLAPDPDTEGEKIAFDLFAYLYPYNQNIERIELHEITRKEFLKRIKEPRKIDFNLVKAQLLRRISDRWVGFKLSEELQEHFQNLNLSAGRVQTPVLGWILEREKKVKEKHYLVQARVNQHNFVFFTEDKDLIKKLKKDFKEGKLKLEIKILEKKEEEINPLFPYDTNELLKDAFNYFRFDSQTTMKLAQDLFEKGLITYHRTDSTYVSEFGRNLAEEYLEKKNLKDLVYKRSWGEIGTHEAIRPTRALEVQDLIEEAIISGQRNLTQNHLKLYGLIFNRFISSQMKPAKGIKVKCLINLEGLNQEEVFFQILEENHLKFFKKVKVDEIQEGVFKIEELRTKKISKEFHYSQGEIIEKMKKEGLGRPSTYAVIIQTLLERKYVMDRSGYLIPTNWSEKIYNYLIQRHPDLISQDFTVKLEEKMDLVAEGKENYQENLRSLFKRIFSE